MKITSRLYGRENDFELLKDFVTTVMADDMQHSYWHVGDLLWGIYIRILFSIRDIHKTICFKANGERKRDTKLYDEQRRAVGCRNRVHQKRWR